MGVKRPGKCPHCHAEYSTAGEMQRHLECKWEHLRERLARAMKVVVAAGELRDRLVDDDRCDEEQEALVRIVEEYDAETRAALSGTTPRSA